MYFNNVHIIIYAIISIIGLIIGRIVAWSIIRLPEKNKIISFEFFKNPELNKFSTYLYMILVALIYIAVLYKFGLDKEDIFKNLELIKFLCLIPMLIITFVVDLKHRIIPNRLTLTIFETGIIFTFLYGINNINLAKEYLLGSLIGVTIFGLITLLGGVLAGREAMGLGDVKFMGAIGLFYGINPIIEISIMSFIIAAICSIFILIYRLIRKEKDDYIPFGPFLSLSSLACILLPSGFIFESFLYFCSIIGSKLF